MPKESKSRPSAPRSSSVPPSRGYYYRQKCKELRERIAEIEEFNKEMEISLERKRRGIQRMRLERALLIEQVVKHDSAFDDSESNSCPVQETQDPNNSPSTIQETQETQDSKSGPGTSQEILESEDSLGSRSKDSDSDSSSGSVFDPSDSTGNSSSPTTAEAEEEPRCCSGYRIALDLLIHDTVFK